MPPHLHWLEPQDPFPSATLAWGPEDPAPGLLAAGHHLDAEHLQRAYSEGIFPWFGPGQPVLWWSPDPRMVLRPQEFRLHRSLRRTLLKFLAQRGCEIRVDSAFEEVMRACANTARPGQDGTWIVPGVIQAYAAFHAAGHAHSVETWIDGRLVGGLYCVGIGRAVFGESMFAHQTDASKIALSALVALCKAHAVPQIDCQQATAHLSFMGAREVARADFVRTVRQETARPDMRWRFSPLYWDQLLSPPCP